jgi:hypothetical protein
VIYIDLVRLNIRTGIIGHRGRCDRLRTHSNGWKTTDRIDGETTLRRRISSAKIRTRDSSFVWRRPHGDAWTSHDFRDARQVRRLSQVESVQITPTSNDCSNRRLRIGSGRNAIAKRWWCFGGIVGYAASNEGQFIFTLLKDFGLTPAEWREMDPRDMTFLTSAFAERLRLETKAREDSKRRSR